MKRTHQDKAREAAGKSSIGPAILEEVLDAVQAFSSAFTSIERESTLIILAVADNESAVVFPRKNHLADLMDTQTSEARVQDTRRIKQDLIMGVAELVTRASRKKQPDAAGRQGAMAAAFSMALCIINRFLVAAGMGGGVSAFGNENVLDSTEAEGVVALMGNSGGNKSKKKKSLSSWSPRILLVQASKDRSRDYNAFMNCAFAAVKHQVVVDACYIAEGGKSSSAFLEQVCDLTGGVFLAPTGGAQLGGALTEVMLSVFLAPLSCRGDMALPALNKVDFRARCFEESAEIVDMAFVCNQCLSIFKNKQPKGGHCPTCQAKILDPVSR